MQITMFTDKENYHFSNIKTDNITLIMNYVQEKNFKSIQLSLSACAVSYTHLDVYKRQLVSH